VGKCRPVGGNTLSGSERRAIVVEEKLILRIGHRIVEVLGGRRFELDGQGTQVSGGRYTFHVRRSISKKFLRRGKRRVNRSRAGQGGSRSLLGRQGKVMLISERQDEGQSYL